MAALNSLQTDLTSSQNTSNGEDSNLQLKMDCFGRMGSQIDEKIEFKDRFSQSISGYPVIIDFRRVLQLGQTSEESGVISGVSNRDLLHAVVGLYDVSLGDMDAETIYSTVCEKWSRTIVIAQDLKDAADEYTERKVKKSRKKKSGEATTQKSEDSKRINVEEDSYKDEEVVTSAFIDVYSDTDEEEDGDEEEEEEEEENFSKGIHSFIKKSEERRKKRDDHTGIVPPEMIGIENRILACATFEKKFVRHKERVIHLTLISVRPRYRKHRIGRYLLSKCVAPSVVGNYDAVVVHADNSAVDFFGRFGFSDDIILNSKWSELAESFTNCTLMTYLPAFSAHDLVHSEVTKEQDPDLHEIDQELKTWQTKSREAYQGQLCCMMKLRNEILQLKQITKSQNKLLNKLLTDNDNMRKDKLSLEKKLLNLQIGQGDGADDLNGGEEIDTDQLIRDLESHVSSLSARDPGELETDVTTPSPPPPTPPADTPPVGIPAAGSNADIIARFLHGMELDRAISLHYTVTSILRPPETSSTRATFESHLRKVQEPSMVTTLYYCGSLERPSRLSHVLAHGLSEEDFSHGEFGRGLYLSKYPSKAAQFSALGKLLEVHAAIGNVETVMRYDRTRKSPSATFDSILTPGRLYRPGDQGETAMLAQEYVIFDPKQVVPVCVLSYTAYVGC